MYKGYQQCTNNENWSPKARCRYQHRVFTVPLSKFSVMNKVNQCQLRSSLDSVGYQHNNQTIDICNKHNITVYRITPNTTGWLQPCDIVLSGPAKQKVRHLVLYTINIDLIDCQIYN